MIRRGPRTRAPMQESRRRFLGRMAMLAAGAVGSSACGLLAAQNAPTATAPPPATVTATASATATLTPSPSATPLPPTFTPTPDPRTPVAVTRADDYDLASVRAALQSALEGLGGIADIIRPGTRVAIKVNLTGGTMWIRPGGQPAQEVYLTHPVVVQALCELLRDAGAAEISITDGVVEDASWDAFGYREVAQAVGAQLIDLNGTAPYNVYSRVPVGPNWQVYETFTLNPLLTEIDAFISVPKLKVHYTAGLTLALKNLVGITPVSLYRNQPEDNHRSALHGGLVGGVDGRLVRAFLDLNRARPVHLAVIDGIWTCEGGEAPWQTSMSPIRPGLLVAAKNAVAADSVAAALMGFDPAAPDRSIPFTRSENYLHLAAEQGLGVTDLASIRVVGESIETARMAFQPVP